MNATTQVEGQALAADRPTGLALLRQPVPAHLISPLPKGTKAQNECPVDQKRHCHICKGFHHPSVVHLDYVGHAAATHLLLDADPHWHWEPLAFDADGLPKFDSSGGLWIRLTVCGVTRLGYGQAEAKGHMDKGSREKEIIGDAIRNAAMRFGLALELWSKADIHADADEDDGSGGGDGGAHGPGTPAGASSNPPAAERGAPLPPYPIEDFNLNLPDWTKVINAGKKTADDVIAKIETKGLLTASQKATLRAIKKTTT